MITNFLNISDLSKKQLLDIIFQKNNKKKLYGKNIGLIFEKPSTRTRLSFLVGISQLGANSLEIKYSDLNIVRQESFEDTFRAMNCYLDGLIIRTTDHQKLLNATKYFKKPIINALSEISHPCQAISDIYTLYHHFNSLKLNILWIGDMNNVCFSLAECVNIIDEINLTILTPNIISSNIEWTLNDNISVKKDLNDLIIENFDCIMTDVFISMNDVSDDTKINALKNYQVNSKLMDKTNSKCVFMHCLPAKIGSEVTYDVIESDKSIIWKQAENRLHSQKSLLQCIDW